MRSSARSYSFTTVLALVLYFPAAAAAQSVAEANTVTVTPWVSASFQTSLGNSLGFGAAIAYDFTPHLAVEGEIGRVFDVLGDNANQDWAITNISANAVYNFDVKRITPYATLGLGVERSSPRVKVPDPLAIYVAASTEVAYNIGGGVKYPVSERFLARADLRRFQANDVAPDHWRFYGGLTWWITR